MNGVAALKPLVVVPDDINGTYAASPSLARLRDMARVELHASRATNEDELIARVCNADVILTFRPAFTRFPRRVIEACPNLRLICVSGTGVEDVDATAARERGVAVANVVGSANRAVAELCVAFMFALARRLGQQDASIRAGRWQGVTGFELGGRTLGLIGLGGIASELAAMARGLGMRVISWSRNNDIERARAAGADAVELDQLLTQADVVSLHLRLAAETRGFINEARISQMKRGALLLNTARGGLVDEPALVAALESGQLGGAGLDVFSEEPLPASSALRTLPNVVMTPVSGWNTTEAGRRMIDISIDNVVGFLQGNPRNVVIGEKR